MSETQIDNSNPNRIPGKKSGTERFTTPQYTPGTPQNFQPNNKEITIQTDGGLESYFPDWATKILKQELAGKHVPRRLRDRASAMTRKTGKFATKSRRSETK